MKINWSASGNILLFPKTYASCWPQYAENPSKYDSSLTLKCVFQAAMWNQQNHKAMEFCLNFLKHKLDRNDSRAKRLGGSSKLLLDQRTVELWSNENFVEIWKFSGVLLTSERQDAFKSKVIF